ncbi:MAG: GTP-binding protein EngB [Candidatus Hadarchaeales archaeon]
MAELVFVGRSNVGKSSLIRALTGKRVRVGRRPGVTRRIARYQWGRVEVVDMPGFGFMSGVPEALQERIKTQIVRYLEKNRRRISASVEVLDAKAFLEIAERWEKRGQVPVDVEMFQFLNELDLDPIVAANKIDLIHREDRDIFLDMIADKLGLLPPWRQWIDTIVPVSAKTGEGVSYLRSLIMERVKGRRAK